MEVNKIYNEDNITGMSRIPDNSIDCILTDPPYLYLKNQKLDRPFNEALFFSECKRVLKKEGFIILFGRGTSFYRWNTMLADLGFKFKEEIVWNKSYCTSPLMSISRIHETASVHSMAGTINKVKIPYIEMKKHDIPSICQDIKRLCAVFNNPKSLAAVSEFLKNNRRDTSDSWHANNLSISSNITKEDRGVSVMRSISQGTNEKSIIRTDRYDCDTFTKFGINSDKRKTGDRSVNVLQSVEFGLNEKTIIRETGDHYSAIHPTQKPVRLLERLLALTTKPGDIVLDPFAGSCSTAVACYNTDRQFICFEIDKEYYDLASERVRKVMQQMKIEPIQPI
jgi:site-specific DNA-methyltransferase (adenine-specific)